MPEKTVGITIKVGVKGVAEKEKLIKNLGKLGNVASKTGKKTKQSLQEITPTMQKLWQEADKLAAHWGVSFQTALPYVKKLGQSFKFAVVDTHKLAQAAEVTSKKFNVSFKRTYEILREMSVGLKGVSNDTDRTAKAARKFSKEFGIPFKEAWKHVNKLGIGVKKATSVISHDIDRTAKIARVFAKNWGVSFKDAYRHINRLGIGVKKAEKQVVTSNKKMGLSFTLIAWHFRYLGNIFDRVSKSMVRMIKDVIKVSSELEESFLSISVAGAIFGRDAERASEFAKELARTGLMPLQDAANSVKNLMITGLGLPELEKFTYRYLDVAFLFTSGADEMAKSLDTITRSILKGTMQLATDATAKELWITTEKRLKNQIGLTMKELTAEQRALELLITIEEKWAATQGLHEMEMNTTRAAMTRLNFAITEIKNAIGIALLPILYALSDAMVKVSVYVNALTRALGPTLPIVIALSVALAFLTSKISFTIGVLISLMKIAGMTALAMWKIAFPILVIGVAIAGLTYLYLKHSGALDRASNSAARMKEQLRKLTEEFTGLSRASDIEGIEEDRRIAHERTVEDIEESLERERSKGLWANQMSIKDLEKRLRRENEDWNRYLAKRGAAEEASGKSTGTIFDNLFEDISGFSEEIGKIDWWGDMLKSLKSVMKVIIEEFQKLPPIVQGIFAGIATYLAITWGAKAFGAIASFVVLSIAKFGALGGAWTILAATIATPLAIAILVGAAIVAIASVIAAYKELDIVINGMDNSISRMTKSQNDYLDMIAEKFGKQSDEYRKVAEGISRDSRQVVDAAGEVADALDPLKMLKGLGGTIWGWLQTPVEIPKMQTGGIVPGMRNQAVPIIAHGGERIIPARESAGGGNITININNPTVRSQEDINSIARAVSNVLGQRQKFSRLGAF